MDASNILFRCSSLGYIMTEPRSKSEGLSETTKTHLVDVFVSNKYGRNTDIQTKYTNKGMMVEEDAITLYSLYKGEYFEKNKHQFSNDFIKGSPDIILEDRVIDIKSSWDIFTFHRSKERINKMYYWQLQGYMALTGLERGTISYCLIDTPLILLNDEKRKLMWKMGALSDQSPDYLSACEELDKLMTYTDIPLEEKCYEVEIERNQDDIERLFARVQQCREYMNENLFVESNKDYPFIIQRIKELQSKLK